MRAMIKNFDPAKIADSGQCFRMRALECGAYGVVARDRYVEIRPLGKAAFDFSCGEAEFDAFWRGYFDLDVDYDAIFSRVDPKDAFLLDAIAYGRGIRLLRQDAWEMTVSFIISQRKNIPAIRRSVEALCTRFGAPIDTPRGTLYAFPKPEALMGLGCQDLAGCSLGYRDKYVLDAARAFTCGGLSHARLSSLDAGGARAALMEIFGVGEKVAACVLLFSLHDVDAVPVDVWIRRVIDEEYGGCYPSHSYQGCAGILQQFMFNYARSDAYGYHAKNRAVLL